MLRDPKTVYPVVLDPSFNPTDIGTDWGMYWSSGEHWYGADDTIPRVGYDGWSSATKKSRSFYKFDVSSLAGTQILSASFVHDQIHSPEHTCNNPDGASIQVWTVEPFGSSMRWPGPDLDAYQDRNTKARGSEDYCFQDHYYNEWNVANGLQDAADAGQATFRLGMIAPNEANDMSWRKYRKSGSAYPKMEIVYNRKPGTPGRLADLNDNSTQGAAVSYGGKWWLRTHYPILSAAAIDPDGDDVALSFTLKNASGSRVASHTTGWVNSNSDTQWTTPYMPEGSYTWQVSAKDVHGFGGPTATSGTFVIDTTPPKAPTLTPSSTVASYGQGVSIRIQASDSDVRYYLYGFLTSATPLASGSLSPLGSAATVTRTGHMGPDWITAVALDVAGNKSAAAKAEFKVMGAATSHQWRLDGNGSDQAASEGSPLTFYGSPALNAAGRFHDYNPLNTGSTSWAASDLALQLNGTSQYAQTDGGYADVANLAKGFAVSAWVKLDADATNAEHVVASFALPGAAATSALLEYNNGAWRFKVRTTTNDWYETGGTTGGTVAGVAGKWTHLVGVYEPVPSRVRLYVDGLQVGASVSVPGTIDQPSTESLTPLRVGAGGTTTAAAFFDGLIDEVRLFSGPLDPTGAYLVSREVRNTP
jgi:hypothetical protein